MVENRLGLLFGQIAESIRSGLGDIGKLKPNAFPAKIDDIVALIGTGGEPGGEGTGSVGPLTFASGSFPLIEDGQRVTIEHGLGVMPDLILVQVVNYLNFTNYEEAAQTQAMMAAWGMRSSLGNGYHSGYVSTVWGLNKSYGIDNMPVEDQAFGYIFCPDEATFQVGSTGEVGKLYSKTGYRWLAISGIESGSGGSSADVRYVTFKSHDGQIEYGKKAVAVGDDCADPIARGVFATPTRESDVQYNYTFYGWATAPNGGAVSNWNKTITEDKTVYANFSKTVRNYTITYYDSDGTTVLKTESLPYGSMPSYTGEKEGVIFDGWTPELATVTGNMSYTAKWAENITFADGTWADIVRITESGEAQKYFAIGDTKELSFKDTDGTNRTGKVKIVGFNKDTLSDGSGTAGMTIVITSALFETVLHASTPYPGWSSCSLRTALHNTVIPSFPEALQNGLKTVKKTSRKYVNGTDTTGLNTSDDKIWIPSLGETGVSTVYSGYGASGETNPGYAQMPDLTSNDTYGDGLVNKHIWTRSASYKQQNYAIARTNTSNVPVNATFPTNKRGCLFGFCI